MYINLNQSLAGSMTPKKGIAVRMAAAKAGLDPSRLKAAQVMSLKQKLATSYTAPKPVANAGTRSEGWSLAPAPLQVTPKPAATVPAPQPTTIDISTTPALLAPGETALSPAYPAMDIATAPVQMLTPGAPAQAASYATSSAAPGISKKLLVGGGLAAAGLVALMTLMD